MKKILLIPALALLLTSCSKWLDVKPFDQMDKEEIYSSERNTNLALNGLYILMVNRSLYGTDMSTVAVEVLGQNFAIPSLPAGEHRYASVSKYEYSDDNSKLVFFNIFNQAYKLIADCNEFLQEVEIHKANYSQEAYDIFMGEALAIRTMVHFDMMRLFGPQGDRQSESSVPYYNISSDVPLPILTTEEMLDVLTEDIDRAITHLKNDPILTFGIKEETTDDITNLNMRMNYYAAWALKARILMWRGTEESKAEAYTITSRMIGRLDPADPHVMTNFDKKHGFDFVNQSTSQLFRQPKVFYPEVLFGIHNTRIETVVKSYFGADLKIESRLSITPAFYDNIYVSSAAGPDGRGSGVRLTMWSFEGMQIEGEDGGTKPSNDAYYRFTRYNRNNNNILTEFMGLIRMGELYLIAAEAAPDLETKCKYLDLLRTGKGYDPGNVNGITEAQAEEILKAEMHKETFGEGQWFFFNKRRSATSIPDQSGSSTSMTPEKYRVPLPEQETDGRGNFDEQK